MNKNALTYDDIQLVPSFSTVESRKNISLRTKLSTNFEIDIPLVASPMDTVCEKDMAYRMWVMGGVGCIHRFMTITEQCEEVKKLVSNIKVNLANTIDDFDIIKSVFEKTPIMAAIGSNGDFLERAIALSEVGANVLIIDVAHGHHINVKRAIEAIKASNIKVDVIAGNIATAQAAIDLQEWGADGLRVGIGGGCFTPGMKVKTSEGYVSIVDVKIGDKVYSHNGKLNEVLNKFEFDRDEEIMIINDIECTKNHEFYVVNKKYKSIIDETNISEYDEWIPAENLTDDYFLVEISDMNIMKLVEIKSIEKKHYTGKVYDLTVDKTHSYNVNSIVVHNSLCTTRIKTGFGVPNVTCLDEIVKVAKIPVMADGGIRNSGDISKALALGSSTVMLGSLLAGTEESPGKIIERPDGLYKRYRGSASLETKTAHGQEERNVEGESTVIPYKGGTKFIIEGLIDGVRSALSYGGANNLLEYRPEWVQITNAGANEAKPHLIK